MSEFDHERETGKEYKSQDYYTGCYWGNHPYDSNELAGRITDEQLKYSILRYLKKNNMMKSYMTKYVKEGMAILTGLYEDTHRKTVDRSTTFEYSCGYRTGAGPISAS